MVTFEPLWASGGGWDGEVIVEDDADAVAWFGCGWLGRGRCVVAPDSMVLKGPI